MFGDAVEIVVGRAWQDMEQHVIDLEVILALERPVVLADIDAVTELADEALFDEINEIETGLELFGRQLPGLYDVALRHDQHMPRDFVRVTEDDLGQVILFGDRVVIASTEGAKIGFWHALCHLVFEFRDALFVVLEIFGQRIGDGVNLGFEIMYRCFEFRLELGDILLSSHISSRLRNGRGDELLQVVELGVIHSLQSIAARAMLCQL